MLDSAVSRATNKRLGDRFGCTPQLFQACEGLNRLECERAYDVGRVIRHSLSDLGSTAGKGRAKRQEIEKDRRFTCRLNGMLSFWCSVRSREFVFNVCVKGLLKGVFVTRFVRLFLILELCYVNVTLN